MSKLRDVYAPPRTFVLIVGVLAVSCLLAVATEMFFAPPASAQTQTYNLCDRSPAMRDQILLALQYPNRQLDSRRLGTISSTYESWGTYDASKGYYTNFYCPGQRDGEGKLITATPAPAATPKPGGGGGDGKNVNPPKNTDPVTPAVTPMVITKAKLASDADWSTSNKRLSLVNKGLTTLLKTDFNGLTNVSWIEISGNSITALPDNVFKDRNVKVFQSLSGNAGLVPSWRWFGSADAPKVEQFVINGNGLKPAAQSGAPNVPHVANSLKHSDIPHDAFDGFYNSSATTSDAASKLTTLKLRGHSLLGHLNLRWFEKLTNLDNLEIAGSTVDTYFYSEGNTGSADTVRYVDGTAATEGTTNFPRVKTLATRDAIGAAIKAEIDRAWNAAKSTTGGATAATINTSNRVKGPVSGFNLCDPLDRQAWIMPMIVNGLKDPDQDESTPVNRVYTETGCFPGDTAGGAVSKVDLYKMEAWWSPNTIYTPFFKPSGVATSIAKLDLKGLRIRRMDLIDSSIKELPEDVFEDVEMHTLQIQNLDGFKFAPKSWFGTAASTLNKLVFRNSSLAYYDIAFDEFDGFTSLSELDLRENPIGYINARWFEQMSGLSKLYLGDSNVGAYFYDANGNDADHADTVGYAEFWDSQALQTFINGYTTPTIDYGATQGLSVPQLAVDVCNLPKAIWAEYMRDANLLPAIPEPAGSGGPTDPSAGPPGAGSTSYGSTTFAFASVFNPALQNVATEDLDLYRSAYRSYVGDVRHARWASVTTEQCLPVPGTAVVMATGATVDPESTAYVADTHDTSINIQHLNFYGMANLGPTLNPDHFANLYHVRNVYLDYAGVSSIPANTFAQAPRIRRLSLRGNSLDNADFAGTNFLANLSSLRVLELEDNLLTRFTSDWLPASADAGSAKPLQVLRLSSNPLVSVDVSGLSLLDLQLASTQLQSLDASVFTQDRLQSFWYQSPELNIDGLHPGGTQSTFLAALPVTLRVSEPHKFLGNTAGHENAALDAAAVGFQIAHNARMFAINSAAAHNSVVQAATLFDPCRPDIWTLGSPATWADPNQTGNLCLTDAQKNSWLTSIAGLRAGDWFSAYNTDFTDDQAETFIRVATGGPLRRFTMASNPRAFGPGFNNTILDRFQRVQCRWMWQLRIVHSDLRFSQAQALLNALGEAYDTTAVYSGQGLSRKLEYTRNHLLHLDLSYNARLFTGASDADLRQLLNRVTPVQQRYGPFTLELAGTNLDFDTLVALLDGIRHYKAAPDNLAVLRSLNVSNNPNLWDGASNDDIEDLMDRLQGLTSLNVSNTGLSGARLGIVMDALSENDAEDRNLKIKSAMSRMETFQVTDTDLGAVAPATLRTDFAKFGGRYATATPALTYLNLARTSIDCADLKSIADGLGDAGVLTSIRHLILDGNPDIFTNCGGVSSYTCDPGSSTDGIVELFKRFTDLRSISIKSSGIDFNELRCVAEGLDAADGDSTDGAAKLREFDINNNPLAFTVPATQSAAAMKATGTQVLNLFQALPVARRVLVHTGLTEALLRSVVQEAQSQSVMLRLTLEEERVRGGEDEDDIPVIIPPDPTVPDGTVRTPVPGDLRVESGRSSLRVLFTHNPMVDGERVDVERYEYRYRPRPVDLDTPWTNAGTQIWRTVNVDLDDTGLKMFAIYGLEPETVYQVQLRSRSELYPSGFSDPVDGGTTVALPEVKRIAPTITEVSMRAGDSVRLEVDIYGMADRLDNNIGANRATSNLIFRWSHDSSGQITEHGRRATYTAPSLPGRYTVRVEAGPDGICVDHHNTDFDISDADRELCQAQFTIRVSRVPNAPDAVVEPINPGGTIPATLTDNDGAEYTVFTPVGGGTFTGAGVTVSAAKGAVPDQEYLGISAAVSSAQVPSAVPGATMTVGGNLYDINAIEGAGEPPVLGYRFDDPITACLPMPAEFRANISDVVVVERKTDGSYGILSTTVRQSAGELLACGAVSSLPVTVGVAKLGLVPEPPVVPTPVVPIGGPDTGATAPSTNMAAFALGLGLALVAAAMAAAAVVTAMRRRRSVAGGKTN